MADAARVAPSTVGGDFWRKRVGGILLSLGLLAASIGYSGLILRGIVTDQDVATNAASAALDDSRVQELLSDETARAIGDQLLGTTTVDSLKAVGYDPTNDLRSIAASVMADPRFARAFVDTVRELHRVVLVEHGPAPVVDVTDLVEVARAAAIQINPSYAALFPPTGTLRVSLPADQLPDLTGVSNTVGDRARLAALVAVGLVAAAMAIDSRRPRILRRIGTWAIGTAVVQGAVAFALPFAADRVPGDLAGVARAVADTLRPRLLAPAAMLAAAGIAMVIVAWRWQRAANATHERVGARAFLGADALAGQATVDAPIELATHRSPMGAPPVSLVMRRDDVSPLPPSPLFSTDVSPRTDVLPTTHQGA